MFTDTDETDSAGEKFKKRLKNALDRRRSCLCGIWRGVMVSKLPNNALLRMMSLLYPAAVHSAPVRALGRWSWLAAGLGTA